MEADTKECPFCAETIKAKAIVCRYCRRDLPVSTDEDSVKSNEIQNNNLEFTPPPSINKSDKKQNELKLRIITNAMNKYKTDVDYSKSGLYWAGSTLQQNFLSLQEIIQYNINYVYICLEKRLGAEQKNELSNFQNLYSSVSTSGAWVLGIDYYLDKRNDAQSALSNKNWNIRCLSTSHLALLTYLANVSYWHIESYLTSFYESRQGSDIRHQKEETLYKLYNQIFFLVKECFIDGIRYKDSR